jgi:hypothetical protein
MIELVRIIDGGEKYQCGLIQIDKKFVCFTLELGWGDNVPFYSCIPVGTYKCVVTKDRRTHGGMPIPRTFEITGVQSRSGILFHIGNYLKDTHGCILCSAGLVTPVGKDPWLNSSRDGFDKFLEATKEMVSFDLIVRDI